MNRIESLLVLGMCLTLLFGGCSKVNSQSVTRLCSGIDDISRECYSQLDEPYSTELRKRTLFGKIFLSEDKTGLTFFTNSNCCTDLELSAVEKDDDIIKIQLYEKGEKSCFCADKLFRVDIELKDPVEADAVEIRQAVEYSDKNNRIYPPLML